jgi:hypothetical protein
MTARPAFTRSVQKHDRSNDHTRDLENVPKGADSMAHAIEVYWHHLNEGHYVAYQDLVIAARTHPELATVLKPAY